MKAMIWAKAAKASVVGAVAMIVLVSAGAIAAQMGKENGPIGEPGKGLLRSALEEEDSEMGPAYEESQNTQFTLNVVYWLSGLLDGR